METKRDLIKTLGELTEDYSELISERSKADGLYFAESVPQPKLFKKSDGTDFVLDDCEKIIAGNYKLNGEQLTKAKDGQIGKIVNAEPVELTYKSSAKQETASSEEIKKPEKKELIQPWKPEPVKIIGRKPLFVILSAVTFVLFIIGIILLGVRALPVIGYLMLAIGILGTFILCGLSNGGIFGWLISLFLLPKRQQEYERQMESYKKELAIYQKEEAAAQSEYENALKEYERAKEAAEKSYKEKSESLKTQYKTAVRKEREAVLAEIDEYIGICEQYLERKENAEAEYEEQKVIIKQKYEAVAEKIKSYPDLIPPKYLKVPEFEESYWYAVNTNFEELKAYLGILESGRADTLKEATNCYIADKQAEEQTRILEGQALEQQRQAEELANSQKCFATVCPKCKCHYNSNYYCEYKDDGWGGCRNFVEY